VREGGGIDSVTIVESRFVRSWNSCALIVTSKARIWVLTVVGFPSVYYQGNRVRVVHCGSDRDNLLLRSTSLLTCWLRREVKYAA
jgi:hypothetical protein